jgi:hypothetical protein
VLFSLRAKDRSEVTELRPTDGFLELHEEIWRAQVAIVFWDFVLQNEMVSKRVPRQLVDQPVILMQVTTVMSENKIRINDPLYSFELVFDFGSPIGEKTIAMRPDHNIFRPCTAQEKASTTQRFASANSIRAEDNPVDAGRRVSLEQAQNGTAAADLDIVRMRPKTKNGGAPSVCHR